MLAMAKKADSVYNKLLEVINRYEDGDLLGQRHCSTEGKLSTMPLYKFRSLSCLKDHNAELVLEMLLKEKLGVNKIREEINRAKNVQFVQKALCKVFKATSWEDLKTRFPRHMTREILSNQFGNVSKLK